MSKVLVTGGTGFIAGHTLVQLVAAGHEVRATVRSLKREGEVRAMLKAGGADANVVLQLFEADLTSDAGWPQAVAGCDYVLHLASPFPATIPDHEDDLIVPARDGALRVLRAARDAGVKRVVLTSSFAAIGYGHKQPKLPLDETSWSDPDAGIPVYHKSKTVAERAAWEFMAKEGGAMELAVVNPTAVFGPVLGADYSTSIGLLQSMMQGVLPGCPKLYFGVVDVRDVADLHLRAMTDPKAKGERFLCTAGNCMSVLDIANTLKTNMGDAAKKVPARELPNWLVRLAALRNPMIRQSLPELGKVKTLSNAKARTVLGWQPRSNEESIVAAAQSLLKLGLLKT